MHALFGYCIFSKNPPKREKRDDGWCEKLWCLVSEILNASNCRPQLIYFLGKFIFLSDMSELSPTYGAIPFTILNHHFIFISVVIIIITSLIIMRLLMHCEFYIYQRSKLTYNYVRNFSYLLIWIILPLPIIVSMLHTSECGASTPSSSISLSNWTQITWN